MKNIFFDSWESLIRASIITILAYIILIFMLRSSGKRTLAKMNAYDFVVTIALGSCLATVALNKSVTLIDGSLVFFLLIAMQYLVTWLSVRFNSIKNLVTHQPTLVIYNGNLLKDVIKRKRITIEEIYIAARQNGISDLQQIDVMVLENTGDLSVISKVKVEGHSTLQNVDGLS